MTDDVVIGVDIGGTNLRTGVVDRTGGLSHFSLTSSRKKLLGPKTASRLVDHVAKSIERSGVAPRAIAVGFPSTVDNTRRVVLSTSNIPGLNNIRFADLLEEALGIPTFLNRDTNLLLLHDIAALGLADQRVIVGCYPGTGFGSALWIGGQLHVGKTGAEGELGHIPVRDCELVCGCGNVGCVETIASGIYLEHLAETHFPGTPLGELFVEHGESEQLRRFVDNLSLPIATAINILDPDAVIVGGGVTAMPGFPRDLLVERVRVRTRKPQPEASLNLVYSEPGQENGVIGAGIYGFSQLEEAKS
ncbi:MAG: allose kinase [Propionicimonas sp.]